MQAQSFLKKIDSCLTNLKEKSRKAVGSIADIKIFPCGYKENNSFPELSMFRDFNKDDLWGEGSDTHAWFYFKTPVTEAKEGKKYFLKIATEYNGWNAHNPQFIVYIDGVLTQGLDTNHREVIIDVSVEHEIYLYAYTGMNVKNAHLYAKLLELDVLIEKLWYDIKVPFDSLQYLNKYGSEYSNILSCLNSAVDCLDMLEYEDGSEAFYQSVRRASEYMDEVFYGKLCGQNSNTPTTVCIGHTHIDCAWHWTLRQTREKVQRSFSTVVALMEQYPEYRFMSSQALLYKFLKEEASDIYQRVRQLIAEGRWECDGSMWVEADCNLSSGESLIRQIMYGKRFFKEEFGVDNHILWLPDVFGYSAALPQILRKCGVDWFVTSKISWNDCNQMPYDTFDWQGIDGTKIHSYFLTAQNKKAGQSPALHTTYVATTTPAMASGTFERYQQKMLSDEALLTFGFGDGGGGPTADQLEMARRLSHGIPGTPKIKIEFAGDFLSRLQTKIQVNPALPVWQGELYLEYHRGTYTSVSKNKKNNRQSEFLYQNAEWLSTVAKMLCGKEFPKRELREGWELILTNQFHDIIPGTSIGQVYDQCDIDYAAVKKIGEWAVSKAQRAIADGISKDCGYVVFNPNSTEGCGIVSLDGVCAYVEGIPAKGYACVKNFKTTNSIAVGDRTLENKFFRLCFDGDMLLTSVYDKRAEREVLADGGHGNELRVYADYPDKYDAWEWQEFSAEGQYRVIKDVQSYTPVCDGVRAGFKIERKHMSSTVTQMVWLYDDIDRIDFDTEVDWKQRHQMLKAAFSVDINSDQATFEIQYGSIKRPTHKNTSWDAMKFETCAHKFADLSEGGFGVSLLNDCKYGHDIHGGEMSLSLLKSATYPDANADLGKMRCVYSLVPHMGALSLPKISAMAYELNNPMSAVAANAEISTLPESFFIVSCDRANIVCEVVKEAEFGEDIVLRLYENSNSKTKATLTFGFDVSIVSLCDMLENEMRKLNVEGNKLSIEFGAFEIHTLKLRKA